MRSRAELRGWIETALRIASIAILAWALWVSLDRGRSEEVVSARSLNLSSALRDWSTSGVAPDRIHVQLDSTPTPRDRDWLAALNRSGSQVSWSGDLPPIAVDVHPVASPRGGLTVSAAAPSAETLVISDDVGALDTVQARGGGARFAIPAASGSVVLRAGGSIAEATLPAPLQVRRVLVLGGAGWESKFVVAALEEDGWKVDSEMRVAPGVTVTQGSVVSIDTATYSAVIVLDTAGGLRASEISRYVERGGGVILAGTAARAPGFASVRAGVIGTAASPPAVASEPGSTTLQSLSVTPVTAMRSDAIVLDRRGGIVAAAVRRQVGGRVLQTGYVDTWRWRMSGGESSVEDHRSWWTRAVASVAYAVPAEASSDRRGVAAERRTASEADNASVARLIGVLGSSASASSGSLATAAASVSLWWLFVMLSFCLLAEWASRRFRGLC